MRTASLGMYDMPWVQAANDALWAGIAARLRSTGLQGIPDQLDRGRPLAEIWCDETLLLAQTCGYPLVTTLRGRVAVVAAPVYDLPGCERARHRSVLVVPAASPFQALDALRGKRVAINSTDSNSGMNLLRAAIAPLAEGQSFFSEVVETGGHLSSIEAVGRGKADLAAIDCVTFGLVMRHRPTLLAGVRIIGETPPSPSLPFVTRAGASPAEIATLRAALASAIADPSLAEATRTLALSGVENSTAEDYEIVALYERGAAAEGYPAIA